MRQHANRIETELIARKGRFPLGGIFRAQRNFSLPFFD